MIEFGDSAINLELWVWTKEKLQRKTVFISALNFAIWEKFRAGGIEIPFPQTDLHIKTGRVKVKNNGNAAVEQEPDGFNELVFEENEAEN